MAISRLKDAVKAFTHLVSSETDEKALLAHGGTILKELVSHDDWLPEAAAVSDDTRYQQYLLHCDPLERLSIVSFVWGPGQCTPIHDHSVWGLIGILRGEERSRRFDKSPDGSLQPSGWVSMGPGDIDVISPRDGDIHEVTNGLADRSSISIHVYGANIGAVSRRVFDPATGNPKTFISGYSNQLVPNLW
jgi:predicted metal-dependent enzyme (double-stranded beta helix superfamily)